jgi:hypothetical protein
MGFGADASNNERFALFFGFSRVFPPLEGSFPLLNSDFPLLNSDFPPSRHRELVLKGRVVEGADTGSEMGATRLCLRCEGKF